MIESWFSQDVKKAVKVQYLDGNVFSQDNNGNKIGVSLYEGETPVNVSGSVSASVIRSDGATVAVTGDSSANQAWVVLPQSCYAVPGVISIVIKATDSSDVTTLCAVVANVYQSSTDTVVDPGTIIPSISDLIAEIEAAVASIPADYSSLWTSLAPAFSSSTAYKIGQYCTNDGGLYRFINPHSGSWSASDVVSVSVGSDITRLLLNSNSMNVSDDFLARTTGTSGGAVFTWQTDGTCVITGGTSTSHGLNVLFNPSPKALPPSVEAGKTYYVNFLTSEFNTKTVTDGVQLQIFCYYTSSTSSYDTWTFLEPGVITIPSNTVWIVLRLRVPPEQSNLNVIVYKVEMLTAPNNEYLYSLQRAGLYGGEDFNDYVKDGVYATLSGRTYTNAPFDSSSLGILEVKRVSFPDHSSNPFILQKFYQWNRGISFTRYKLMSSATWTEWVSSESETQAYVELNILFVGNSLTQDGIAYLPYLLSNYYPYVKFNIFMWFNGGKNLKQQYENYFLTDTPCDIFSVARNTAAWVNYNDSRTMSYILSHYKFDVVCLQEYFNYKSSYTVSDLADWENCKNYITTHYTGGNGLEFVSLFHAPLRSRATEVFNLTVSGNNLILKNTIADDMIPNGIAVYRALSTALDSLGDEGHLSPDGTHTQEGLPCLLQTFVTACWLFDRLGLPASVYGCPIRMTTEIYETLNVPGPNLGTGVITGTDAENLLAQEVAIKAYKEGKYYVMNNQYVPPNA